MSRKLSRRQFVTVTAATSAALVTAPYVRGAYAAGKLSIGFWDHWVPGANKTSTDLVNDWAAKARGSDRLSRLASVRPDQGDFRSTPSNGHRQRRSAGPFRANMRHLDVNRLASLRGLDPVRADLCEEPAAQLAGKLLAGNCGRSAAADGKI